MDHRNGNADYNLDEQSDEVDRTEIMQAVVCHEAPTDMPLEAMLDRLQKHNMVAQQTSQNRNEVTPHCPTFDARELTTGGNLAFIQLDGQTYTLRITRQKKLILTK